MKIRTTIKPLLTMLAAAICVAGSGREAPVQSTCAPADSTAVAWMQGVLSLEAYAVSRDILGISHLQGEVARVLGSEAGDDVICAELYGRLPESIRLDVDRPDAAYLLVYYRVGDRYLVHWISQPGTLLGGSERLIVFDEDFNEIASGFW